MAPRAPLALSRSGLAAGCRGGKETCCTSRTPAPPDGERPLERIYSLCGIYDKAPPSLYVHRPSRARRSLYSYNRHGLEYFPSSGIKAACGSRGPPVLPNYQITKGRCSHTDQIFAATQTIASVRAQRCPLSTPATNRLLHTNVHTQTRTHNSHTPCTHAHNSQQERSKVA
jgi:hypothetical protein